MASWIAWTLVCTPVLQAQPAGLELTWRAPAGCPTAAEVRAEARRTLGVVPDNVPALAAHAHVTREGAGYALRLVTTFQHERGERTLQARDCQALAQSVTLVLAVLLGVEPRTGAPEEPAIGPQTGAPEEPVPAMAAGTSTAGPAESQTVPALESELDAAAPVPVDRPRSPPPQRGLSETRSPHRTSLSLLVAVTAPFGLLPEPALGASVGAALGLGPLLLGLRLHAWASRIQRPADGLRTRMDGVGASLFVCQRLALSSVGVGLCAGAHMAALRGRSDGARSDPGSAVAPWHALSAGAQLTWPRSVPLAVRLWADAALSTQRARFVVRGLDAIHHHVPPVVGQLGLGVVWTP